MWARLAQWADDNVTRHYIDRQRRARALARNRITSRLLLQPFHWAWLLVPLLVGSTLQSTSNQVESPRFAHYSLDVSGIALLVLFGLGTLARIERPPVSDDADVDDEPIPASDDDLDHAP